MQASNANENQEEPVYIHYDTAFPTLNGSSLTQANGSSKIKPKSVKPCSLKTNTVKEFVEIPCSERKNNMVNGSYSGRKQNSFSQLAADISKQFSVEIDINSSKSQSLTIVISGSPENVANARGAVVRSLQTQSKLELHIEPKYHRFIIGRGGQTLISLERDTTTKIQVPSSSKNDSDVITITGPKHGCDAAKRKIMSIVDIHSKLSTERLTIPKMFHAFIKGPRRNNITRWTDCHKVRIDIAPPSSPAEDICVSGDKQKVDLIINEIQKIHKTISSQAKRCVINVPKSQHRLVFGPKGSGLDEILEETGVSVELPQGETDEVILFGPPTKMGSAMSMVISRASSSVRDEIVAPNRFHKVLIGKSGNALASLLEGYQERVRVEFGSQTDRIELDGPVEDVAAVKERLVNRLKELEQTMALQSIKVPSKYHGLIVGRDGVNVRRIREKYNCQISINQNLNETSEIIVEGDSKGIALAVEEILALVKRLENEKVKDMIIEPDIQILLRSTHGAPPPVRALYDEFPKVTFHWAVSMDNARTQPSASDPSLQVCQLTGQRQDVDACADKLAKLVKAVKESNYHQEFRVFKEFRPTFKARDNNKVRQILNDLQCRLQSPPAGTDSSAPSADKSSELWWIVGREKQVHEAIDLIDALQRQILNMKEIRLPIPPFVLAKVVGNQAPRLRSIKEQCDGVSFKFPRSSPEANTSTALAKDIIVYGPSEAVLRAQALIEQLNSKVAELCEEAVVPCDKKFHGMLIGKSGQNIAKFREKHNVELVFPDRYEINPDLANQIQIMGSKVNVPVAKKELLAEIKALEDEAEVSISVPQDLVRNVRQAHNKMQDRVRLSMPRSTVGKKGPNKADQQEETPEASNADIDMRLSGPKVMVENTRQMLQLLIDDLRQYSKMPPRDFPIKGKVHARILNRMKNQLPDLEAEYRVMIKVDLPSREQLDAMQNHPIGQLDADIPVVGHVFIHGRPEQIDAVWEDAIRPNLPIVQKFPLSKDLHRYLVVMPDSPNRRPGQKQRGHEDQMNKATELQEKHGVFVKLPDVNQTDADYVILSGTPTQIQDAETQLKEWAKEWEADKADRIARSYEEKVEINECYLPFITCNKVDAWKNDHEVILRVEREAKKTSQEEEPEKEPEPQEEPAEESDDIHEDEFAEPLYPKETNMILLSTRMKEVTLRGYKEKIALVRKDLEQTLAELEKQERVVLNIPQKVHSQLIGAKRAKQLRVQKDFGVQIEFPNRDARGDSAHIVVVMGPPDKVDQACHHLISTATELMEREESRAVPTTRGGGMLHFNGVVNAHVNGTNGATDSTLKKGGVVMIGAPWSEKNKS